MCALLSDAKSIWVLFLLPFLLALAHHDHHSATSLKYRNSLRYARSNKGELGTLHHKVVVHGPQETNQKERSYIKLTISTAEPYHAAGIEDIFDSPPRWQAKTSEEHQGSIDYEELNKTRTFAYLLSLLS